MKKRNLIFKTVFSTIAIPSTINFIIFKNAKSKVNKTEKDEQYYNWRYGKIFYNVKGEGMPLLLIHGIGIGADSFEWHKNIDILAKYYKVYTLDLIGFGKSNRPNITYTAYMYSILIKDFICNVINEPTNIIASSLSGAFVLKTYNMYKDYFKKIMLICPSGVGNTNTKSEKDDKLLNLLINSPIIGTSIYNYITSKKSCQKFLSKDVFFDTNNLTDEIINNSYYSSHYKGRNSKYVISSFMSNYMNVNVENVLCDIEIPIYIIWGKNAKVNPISDLEIIKKLNPDIQYAIFDQAKLVPHIENSREFNKICKEFF